VVLYKRGKRKKAKSKPYDVRLKNYGNRATYLIARLDRDRPDIAAAFRNGKYTTGGSGEGDARVPTTISKPRKPKRVICWCPRTPRSLYNPTSDEPIRCRRCGALADECGHVPDPPPYPVTFRSHSHRIEVYSWRAGNGYQCFHPDDDPGPPPPLPADVLLDETCAFRYVPPPRVRRVCLIR
jgi:hypothetical protein